MTIEQWCWIDGLAQLLGYRRPAPWSPGTYPMCLLQGQQKRHRRLDIRGCEATIGQGWWDPLQPGWLRITISGRWTWDFDIADPASLDKAAEWIRTTYTKTQQEWERRRLAKEAVQLVRP